MVDGGHCDAGCVEIEIGSEQSLGRCKDRNRVLRGDFSGARRIRLERGNQRDRFSGRLQLAIDTEVIAPERARTGDGDTRDGTAGYCPAPFPSTAARQRV